MLKINQYNMISTTDFLNEKLNESSINRDYLDSLLKSIVDMLIIFDNDFNIQFVNAKTCQLLHHNQFDLIGQPINILFPKSQQRFLNRLLEDILFEEHLYNRETQFKLKERKSLPVSISLSVLKNNQNSTGYLLIAKDIKQLLLATDALKQKNKELKTFVYRVSHDLKGPLASISGLLGLVEQEKESVEIYRHYFNLIKNSTEKLERTLSGLLEIGVASNNNPTYSNFNVRECIEDVVRSFEGYPGRGQVILLISANRDIELNTEEKTFRSILQNLVENSIKYRKNNTDDAVTKISARKYKNGVKIKVKDNGQGMDKQVQNRAFDMFYRGNQGSQGSGLGLFIVKSNIERLGGEIKIKSRPDHGTEMWVYLPTFPTEAVNRKV